MTQAPLQFVADHSKGARSTVRNVLNLKETLGLCKYVKDEYVKSGLNNVDFAAQATANLPAIRHPLNSNHISSALEALDMSSNYTSRPVSVEQSTRLAERVLQLEDQMHRLAATVAWLHEQMK